MNDYTEVRINFAPCSETITDTAAALLADAGFETFVPDNNGLTAYIRTQDYTPELQKQLELMPWDDLKVEWSATNVPGQDWNHEWEKNYFKPIVVGKRCVIHSSFHKDIPTCEYDIVIDPKMAFGTGHHSTTSLIIARLLEMELDGKDVIDMGTGTGILSILAAMRGAGRVTGIEIDPPAWENAVENCKLNNRPEINMILGDATALNDINYLADVMLANINRNVITADISRYCKSLKPGATLILSGFYESDIPVIMQAAEPLGFKYESHTSQLDWACVILTKQPA